MICLRHSTKKNRKIQCCPRLSFFFSLYLIAYTRKRTQTCAHVNIYRQTISLEALNIFWTALKQLKKKPDSKAIRERREQSVTRIRCSLWCDIWSAGYLRTNYKNCTRKIQVGKRRNRLSRAVEVTLCGGGVYTLRLNSPVTNVNVWKLGTTEHCRHTPAVPLFNARILSAVNWNPGGSNCLGSMA